MNEYIKNQMEKHIVDLTKVYNLLDNVLVATALRFPDKEINVSAEGNNFSVEVTSTNGDTCCLHIRYTTTTPFVVNVMVHDGDKYIAECNIGINDEYKESYTRFESDTLRTIIQDYFTNCLSVINIDTEDDAMVAHDLYPVDSASEETELNAINE